VKSTIQNFDSADGNFRIRNVQDTRPFAWYVDAFAAALAIENKATLVTSDSDFRKLGHNFPIVWLKT
jgi:hypothetical protein